MPDYEIPKDFLEKHYMSSHQLYGPCTPQSDLNPFSVVFRQIQPGVPKPTVMTQIQHREITIKRAPFTYLHLTLLSSDSTATVPSVDILTARTYLTSALEQFLGMTGAAIPIDFLKVGGRDVWIRVPREDASKVRGALSQWGGGEGGVTWMVGGKGEWLASLGAGGGRGLFID